ncbi:MAG: DUF2277 domain-containing protein [Myxococcales bacterium]|nr:MAG: DUF2277 domain-containing protein [Myxococcales bacterium]
MCRSIKVLFNFEPPTTDDEIRAAALQYVRKVSGSTRPSARNEAAFQQAVDDIQAITTRLLGRLETSAPPRDPATERARAQARQARRFVPPGQG